MKMTKLKCQFKPKVQMIEKNFGIYAFGFGLEFGF